MQQRSASADTALRPPRQEPKHRRDNKLDKYFTPLSAGDARPAIEDESMPDVATDVNSTYLRLHAKRHMYAEDKNFHIVKNALSECRGSVSQQRL